MTIKTKSYQSTNYKDRNLKKRKNKGKNAIKNSNAIYFVLNLCAIIDEKKLKCFNKYHIYLNLSIVHF